LFNFWYEKNTNLGLIYFNILTGPYPVGHRNENEWKNIRKTKKRGNEEIRDRKLLEIWEKDRTWL
jgi:hypothetical protein